MHVLVTGGSGFIGHRLCRELDDRGHDVTALSRRPEEGDLPGSVATLRGDVTEYRSIESAVEGMDAVVNLVALSPLYKPGGDRSHDAVHRRGTEHCVRAAEEHGVDRFLQMSALGADPEGPTAYLRAKGQAETAVQESDLDWTVLRPSVVFGDGGEFVPFTTRLKRMFAPGLPVYPLPGGGKTRFQPLWVEDLVPMLAAALEEERHAGEVYEIGGPEVLTLAEVARLAFRAEGKSIRIVPVPMPVAKLGLTLADPLPFIPFGSDQGRSLEMDNTVEENDVEAFGVSPAELRTLAAYLEM